MREVYLLRTSLSSFYIPLTDILYSEVVIILTPLLGAENTEEEERI